MKFSLNIIIPIINNIDIFKQTFKKNKRYINRDYIEVLIILGDSTQYELLVNIVKDFPSSKIRIIKTNGSKISNIQHLINIGINYSTKESIFILLPEIEFYTDNISIFKDTLFYYRKKYLIGKFCFANIDEKIKIKNKHFFPCTCLMVNRHHLLAIRGYSKNMDYIESYYNLRSRLEFYGIRKMFIDRAITIFRENEKKFLNLNNFDKSQNVRKISKIWEQIQLSIYHYKETLYPNKYKK